MTALSKHQGKFGKPSEAEQSVKPHPGLIIFIFHLQLPVVSPKGSAVAVSPGNDMMGGLGDRIQSLTSSPPGATSLWSIPSLPQQQEEGSHLSRSPRHLRAADSGPRSLLPVFAPSPGVPISWGLPPLWPTSGGLDLSGPYFWPLGARTGSRALTSPAAGGARVTAAGASAGSARRTDPHSPAGRPGPRAGSDVQSSRRRCLPGSAQE